MQAVIHVVDRVLAPFNVFNPPLVANYRTLGDALKFEGLVNATVRGIVPICRLDVDLPPLPYQRILPILLLGFIWYVPETLEAYLYVCGTPLQSNLSISMQIYGTQLFAFLSGPLFASQASQYAADGFVVPQQASHVQPFAIPRTSKRQWDAPPNP